jgi:hypothetical protein
MGVVVAETIFQQPKLVRGTALDSGFAPSSLVVIIFVSSGHFKHMHLIEHHGRFEMRVPAVFQHGHEAEFREPGGEEIVFRWPHDCHPGELLLVEW